MRSRKLGQSPLEVSEIGLGCNNFGWLVDFPQAREVVFKALDLGVTLFDTADMYGNRGRSEEMLGELLQGRRDRVVFATKFGMAMGDGPEWRGAARRYVMAAAEASLRRLRTDRIDLYQLHQPDPETPIDETLRALEDLVKQGKVLAVGCCNLPAWQFVDALWTARVGSLPPFVSHQAEYSLIARDAARELLPALAAHGTGFLPYFPLAGGLLSGKYRRDASPEGSRLTRTGMGKHFLTEANFERIDRLSGFAAGHGRSLLDLAFAWLLAHPVVASVIAGATSAAQVEQNVAAGAWQLTEAEREEASKLAA